MNVLQNLMELYNQLPADSTYRVVAKGILENLSAAAEGTIYDVAELTDSSRTTVWRMVQKMGYKNYSDFRYALKAAVSQYTYYNRVLSGRLDIDGIMAECGVQLKAAWKLVEKNFSREQAIGLAQRIHSRKKIRFYFYARYYSIYSFQQNLAMDGKDTAYYLLLPEMLSDAKSLGEDSIVFINSIEFSETMDLSPVFEILRRQKCHIVLANCGKSRYEGQADEILFRAAEFSDAMGIASNTVFETFFVMISEIYRRLYLNG